MDSRAKVRAKRVNSGEWVLGGLFQDAHGSYVVTDVVDKNYVVYGGYSTNVNVCAVDEQTICHPCGQQDCFEKDMYEGDICVVRDGTLDEEDGYFVVVWETSTSSFCLEGVGIVVDFDNVYGKDCEIVGNVFDNPELLRGTELEVYLLEKDRSEEHVR